ncbi:MAG: hypothetical protein RsTaC01_0944 [Candidatus Paraimprobicoccus trichonymphae]|uniref:Uncharacterized protein n=1 Tax=Candidatus Paraimprobicoccus trichonymphae TaxID=3033793 RepID=A0AA48ICJ1_9FIRM|nr:MAG: hypothetical protein RsTaC01_0944 [Candidatus Paraimprobicoccus trichonymphae]
MLYLDSTESSLLGPQEIIGGFIIKASRIFSVFFVVFLLFLGVSVLARGANELKDWSTGLVRYSCSDKEWFFHDRSSRKTKGGNIRQIYGPPIVRFGEEIDV